MHKVHRIMVAAAVTAVAGVAGLAVPPQANAGQYYESAQSGTGTNTGTAAFLYTWSSWAVPENPSHPCTHTSGGYCADYQQGVPNGEGFTDEAVWLLHPNSSSALEVGWGSGWAAGTNGGWTSAQQPYYTTGDGANEVNATSSYDLSGDQEIWVQAQNAGWVEVGGWQIDLNYSVTANRQNYTQQETEYGDDWMDGGSPNGAELMYYQPAADYPNGWANWGSISCNATNDSSTGAPFDYANACHLNGSNDQWYGYGYGNGDFGS